MRIWEVIGPNAVKAAERQLDSEDNRIRAKRADLTIKKAQDTIAKAQKRKNKAMQKDGSHSSNLLNIA